ncbi:hypothetical protein MMC07_005720 [Pseudocyphellaria aurata]|nr:hypothetical protein [Pseudocyphellaria aurata]
MNPLRNTTSVRKSKLIFTLDKPYSDTKWPALSPEVQAAILDSLCSFLSPIGAYRGQRLSFSKGKSGRRTSKKRKRPINEDLSKLPMQSAAPEVLDFVTVGFNTTTHHLERLAQTCTGNTATSAGPVVTHGDQVNSDRMIHKHLIAIFVPRAEQPKILHSHLPVLIKTASLGSPDLLPIRLVPLASGAEAQLSKALGIPRVGIVGLMDHAPNASQLVQLTRAHVPAVEIPWLQESTSGVFLPTKVNTIHSTTSADSKKIGRAKASTSAKESQQRTGRC